MKISNLNNGYYHDLLQLNEANVINIKDDFGDSASIAKYLNTYAENLGSPEAKSTFSKKLAKLLMNDERFHYAVRQLPDNAPAWAQEALAKGELVYFQPTPQLNDEMEHLMHYMSVLEQDSKNAGNRDAQVVAQREFDGFSKAETLDLLVTKSNEYFKRGSKKAGASEEGMKLIHDSGNGYKWFLLVTADAYRREGKVLQNCIGTIWTREKATREGKEIIVLRSSTGDSHVAARIDNKTHSVDEMKGKNNKPPIEKYMVPVVDILDKLKLKLSSSAIYDFKLAGYFFIEGKLYSRVDAISKFVRTDEIGKLANGNTLTQINMGSSSLADDLLRVSDAYSNFSKYFKSMSATDSQLKVFEERDKNGKPVISGLVQGKTLIAVQRFVEPGTGVNESLMFLEADAVEVKATGSGKGFVTELMKRGLITDFGTAISKDMFWNTRSKYDKETNTIVPVKANSKFKTDKEHLEWEEHTDRDSINLIKAALSSETKWDKSVADIIKPEDIKSVFIAPGTHTLEYTNEEKPANYALVKTKDNVLIPMMVTDSGKQVTSRNVGVRHSNYVGGNIARQINKKIVDSTVAVANKEQADLTKSFRTTNGIIKDGDTYKVYVPKKKELSGDPSGSVIDISDIDYGDRLAAIVKITTGGQTRRRVTDSETSVHADDFDLASKIDSAITGQKYRHDRYNSNRSISDDASDWDGKEVKDIYSKAFGGATPEKVYLVDVKYGSDKTHEVALLVDKNKIINVDATTATQQFQKWDDYDKVANQLNAFAKNNNLIFDKSAMRKQKELRIHNGQVMAAATVQQQRLQGMKEKGKTGLEGTDSIKFKDDMAWYRMSPEEQSMWTRKALNTDTISGEAWKLSHHNGLTEAIVLVKNNQVQALYTFNGILPKNQPKAEGGTIPQSDEVLETRLKHITRKGLAPKQVGYLKTAMEQFGWTAGKHSKLTIEPNDNFYRILKGLDSRDNRATDIARNKLLRAVGVPGLVGGWSGENSYDRRLYEFGFIDARDLGRNSKALRITPKGKAALEKLEKGESVNMLQHVLPATVSDDWKKPEKKAAPEKPKTSGGGTVPTGKTKAGSSAERALQQFRSFATENNRIPTRSEFMTVLQSAPFNMSKAGAQTYYYTTKAKYAALGEAYSEQALKELLAETGSLRLDARSFSALRTLLIY